MPDLNQWAGTRWANEPHIRVGDPGCMSHHLEIDFGMMSGPELRLVCTATPGSPCRMRPADDRESWSYDDPDLIDGECWAVEWVEGGGMETMASADGVTWPTIPVTVEYDEGVVLAPVAPHPPLWPDGGDRMMPQRADKDHHARQEITA